MWSNLLTETSLCGPLTVVRLKSGWGRKGGEEKESRAKTEAARARQTNGDFREVVRIMDFGLRATGRNQGFRFFSKALASSWRMDLRGDRRLCSGLEWHLACSRGNGDRAKHLKNK